MIDAVPAAAWRTRAAVALGGALLLTADTPSHGDLLAVR